MPNPNETALEKTFSDLAYSHLRDRSQSLLDYLVGFQMLKQEDDGKRAVGIFGFEIDEDYYYAPIFFLNGEIRGLDSLYSVKSDIFMPLTDDWVNTVINRRQLSLGESDTGSRSQRGVHVPNYTRLKVIPGGTGSINLKLASGESVNMFGDREYVNEALPDALAQSGLTGIFKQAMVEHPRLRAAVEEFYSQIDFYDRPQQKAAEEAEPVIIINSIADEGTDELTDEQRKELLDGGTIVIDKRPEVSKSQLYSTETKQVLENPEGGGLFDVLWYDGSVYPAVIAPTSAGTDKLFVFCPDMDKYGIVDRCSVYVVRKYTREEYLDWLRDNTKSASDCRPGEVAVFLSDAGEGTDTLCIEEVVTGADGITCYKCHTHYGDAVGRYDRHVGRGDNGNPPHNGFDELFIGGNGDHEILNRSNRPRDPYNSVKEIIVVPQGNSVPRFTECKLIINDKCFRSLKVNTFKLKNPKWDTSNTASEPQEVYNAPRYDAVLEYSDFGNWNTIHYAVNKLASDLQVWAREGETHIKCAAADSFVSSRSEKEMLGHLMCDLGLGEQDARLVIKTAGATPLTFKLQQSPKTAAEMLQLPESQDTDLGGFMTSFHRQQVPFESLNQAQSEQNREFYQYYSPFGSGADTEENEDTFGTIEKAVQTGEKEVFDAAALASLVKNHNPTDMVDRFLPTITSAMDRLGRMLFLIFWHYEDFEERYGENDLGEFIDNLRSVFEQLGDVIIFAKKRTLAGDPEHYGMGLVPTMDEAS